LKLAALALAVTAWFGLAYNPDTIQRTFVVPIQYRNVPASLVLDQTAPHEARLTLSGSERDFRFLEPATLRVSVDLAGAGSGWQEIDVSDDSIRLPADLSLYGIDPRVIRLNLEQPDTAQSQERAKSGKNGFFPPIL
jgi:hypothetical protein